MRRSLALATFLLAALALAPGAQGQGFQGFQSPSKNIGCFVSQDGARCDIRKHDWKSPRKPSSCELDYGNGLEVESRSKKGRFVCAGDTTLGGGAILGYGKSIRKGSNVCTSRESGVTCKNRAGHGFRISRGSYSRF